jgi:hypothetical protein
MTGPEELSMKTNVKLLLALALVLTVHAGAAAQEGAEKSETADDLQLQLLELQSKEEILRLRAQQLDEDLKPENIERALAGIGSTRPEELREARRRQLTIERESVRLQLRILEKMRIRLEAAIMATGGFDPQWPAAGTRGES